MTKGQGIGDLVTVADAAVALQVSEAQVHNLCGPDGLTKIPPEAGRQNHRAFAACITRSSLDELLLRRQSARQAPRKRSGADRLPRVDEQASTQGRSALASLQAMKVSLDLAREALRAERQRSRGLAKKLEAMAKEVGDALDAAEKVDGIADGYSAALTQLLTDDTAARLGGK